MRLPETKRGMGWFGAGVVLAVAAAYLPAVKGTLLFDDQAYLTPPSLRSVGGLGRIWFRLGTTEQYFPVLHSAFWLEHRLWGDSPLGYHLANLLLHAACAVVFALVLRRLRVPGACFAGLIFALHPVAVESVAWIAEQKNTLSTAFYLLAALTYLGIGEGDDLPANRSGRYALATTLFGLALLSKSATATLPAALVVISWWRHGRLKWRRDLFPLLPWFVLAAADGILTAWVERVYIGAEGGDFALGAIARTLIAGRAAWFYAGKLLWPANLVFIYPRWSVNPGAWKQYLPLLGLATAFAALWWRRRAGRGPLAAALLFVGALAPTLGFLNVYFFIFSFVADHFSYLAMFPVIALAAAGWGQWEASRRFLPQSVAVIVLGVLGVLTWRQCGEYRDAETLYRAVLARNPDSWMAHNNLGNVYLSEPGRLNEAIGQFERALRLKPQFPESHYNLGNAWMKVPGRLGDAVAEYETALRLRPNYADAHNNLGEAWSRIPGRMNDAVAEYEAALRFKPGDPKARYNLGNAWSRMPGRLNDGIAQYEEALRLDPDYTAAHDNLGISLSKAGRSPEAIVQFRQALRLNPDDAEAHFNLAVALLRTGGRAEAREQLNEFLRLRPGNALARRLLESAAAGGP